MTNYAILTTSTTVLTKDLVNNNEIIVSTVEDASGVDIKPGDLSNL